MDEKKMLKKVFKKYGYETKDDVQIITGKKKCKHCGKIKIYKSFLENTGEAGEISYGDVCNTCRAKERTRNEAMFSRWELENGTPLITEVNQRARDMGLSYGIYSSIYIYGKEHDPGLDKLVDKRRQEYRAMFEKKDKEEAATVCEA